MKILQYPPRFFDELSEQELLLVDMTENMKEFFYQLEPETVLQAVEMTGVRATGKSLALNSFENRVYQVEIEIADSNKTSPFDSFRVAKFYRPGRWSKEQIMEEHELLRLLEEHSLPVVAPLPFPDGSTLQEVEGTSLWFCVYKKFGGRHRVELPDNELKQVGRLIGQIHNLAQQVDMRTRLSLTGEQYGVKNIDFLCDSGFLPKESIPAYRSIAEPLVRLASESLKTTQSIRIHGDCHLGNVLWVEDAPIILDFDDMLYGPAIQDIWLLNPGRDEDSQRRQEKLVSGYEELRAFDHSELALVELLRALRIIHFEAWVAKRWEDPAFPRTFEQFGSMQYWRDELAALQEISDIVSEGGQ